VKRATSTLIASSYPFVWCCLCAILLSLNVRTLAQQATISPQPISLQDYALELDRCSAAVGNGGTDAAELRNLRLSLPERWAVQAGEQTYFVDSDWLSADLAKAEAALHKDPAVLQHVRQDINAHRDAAQALARSKSTQDLADSKSELEGILSAKEFKTAHGPTWLENLRARIYDWIARQWEKLRAKLPRSGSIGNAIAWTVIALTTLVLLLWLVRAATRDGARFQMDLRGASAAGQDSAYWLRQARSLAADGDYRSAIHAAYWAGIARLEEAKLLTEDRSRTPRESLRLIRRETAEYAPLSQLTGRFELVWYGYRAAGSADWDDVVQQLETLGCLPSSTPAISAS
jgi:hypothetical protein